MLLLVGAGCGDAQSRKAALSEQEISRLTYGLKPDRQDELIVSGEVVTCEDITKVASEPNVSGTTLRDRLMLLARQMTLEEFLEGARPQIRQRLNNNIASVILYKRARKELGDKADEKLDQMAEKEWRRFVVEHGGNSAAADAALQRMGMNRNRFKEYKKRQMLTQYYVSSKFAHNRPITHSELLAAYDGMKADFQQAGLVQFRLIDLQITKMRLSETDDDPIRAARKLAGELMERIRAGEDFGELAKKYSHDYRSQAGGLWPARDPDALAQPYDVLGKKTYEMRPGELAGPIETLDHVFIMKLEQKQEKGYRPLEEVQDRLVEQITRDRRNEAMERLDAEVARQVAGVDTDRFVDYCLESLHRQTNAAPAGR
jgi:peptidyl-prolyl cis-trans isomerase SurA